MTIPATPVVVVPKNWYTSKTVWLGVAMCLAGIATYFSDPAHTPVGTVASISEALFGVMSIVIRVVTSVPLAGTPAAAALLPEHPS